MCSAMQLGPYFIPKGTGVHINLWAMQHDERYWKDPEAFKPERWIGNAKGGDMSDGMAYMPFGLGPRMCIGIKLACKCSACIHVLAPVVSFLQLCMRVYCFYRLSLQV